jgi:hypothetical protein
VPKSDIIELALLLAMLHGGFGMRFVRCSTLRPSSFFL